MTSSPRSNWNYPTAVRFGAGRISELAEACKAGRHAGAAARHRSRPGQLADDEGGARQLKRGSQAAMFSEIKPNPVETNVYAGIEA